MPLQIIRNDLTRMACDAVVNPTDERFSGSGGLDGQIHRAAGSALDRACARFGGCAPGQAVLTKGCDLPAKHIIHTVGPRWIDGAHRERETLAACYRACLALAKAHRFASVAFPIISAGSFGFPKEEALEIAVREIRAFLSREEMDVFLVVFHRECYAISASLHAEVQSYIDQNYVDALAAHDSAAGNRREVLLSSAPMASMRDQAPRPTARPAAKRREHTPASAPFGPDRVLDESFSQMLLRKIDERGMTDAECYKRANLDRKHFSKIRKDPQYRPKKTTAIALAVALELNLAETRELLMKAGFALSRSYRFDVIIEYFIREGMYDVDAINETLFDFDQPLLGG